MINVKQFKNLMEENGVRQTAVVFPLWFCLIIIWRSFSPPLIIETRYMFGYFQKQEIEIETTIWAIFNGTLQQFILETGYKG